MLKLVLDVKCGYESQYITIKDYELDVSYLAKESFYKKLILLTGEKINSEVVPSEDDIYVEYNLKPDKLIKDFSLANIVLGVIAGEIGRKHFPEAMRPDTDALVFPELFTLRNIRLAISQDTQANRQTDSEAEKLLDELFTDEDSNKEESVEEKDTEPDKAFEA